MLIIGITGKKRHGKDTVSDYLVEKYGFKKYVLADILKRALKEMFSLTDDQLWGNKKEVKDKFWNYSPRELMQIVGTNLIRDQFDKDFFVKSLRKKILEESFERVIVSDIRFLNEVKMIEDLGGIVYRVKRNSIKNEDSHCSENDLDNKEFITIQNNTSLNELYNKIDIIMNKYVN